MPNISRITSPFLQTGNPDTLAISLSASTTPGAFTPYAPGDLGASWDINNRTYSFVVLDSGATAAAASGSVAAGQLLYWKDKANFLVTNDSRFAVGGQTSNAWRNSVAGVARIAVATPGPGGTLIAMLSRGQAIPVASDGSGGQGQSAIASSSTTAATVTPIAVGTAPTYQVVGIMRSTPANSLVNVDVDIPTLP